LKTENESKDFGENQKSTKKGPGELNLKRALPSPKPTKRDSRKCAKGKTKTARERRLLSGKMAQRSKHGVKIKKGGGEASKRDRNRG